MLNFISKSPIRKLIIATSSQKNNSNLGSTIIQKRIDHYHNRSQNNRSPDNSSTTNVTNFPHINMYSNLSNEGSTSFLVNYLNNNSSSNRNSNPNTGICNNNSNISANKTSALEGSVGRRYQKVKPKLYCSKSQKEIEEIEKLKVKNKNLFPTLKMPSIDNKNNELCYEIRRGGKIFMRGEREENMRRVKRIKNAKENLIRVFKEEDEEEAEKRAMQSMEGAVIVKVKKQLELKNINADIDIRSGNANSLTHSYSKKISNSLISPEFQTSNLNNNTCIENNSTTTNMKNVLSGAKTSKTNNFAISGIPLNQLNTATNNGSMADMSNNSRIYNSSLSNNNSSANLFKLTKANIIGKKKLPFWERAKECIKYVEPDDKMKKYGKLVEKKSVEDFIRDTNKVLELRYIINLKKERYKKLLSARQDEMCSIEYTVKSIQSKMDLIKNGYFDINDRELRKLGTIIHTQSEVTYQYKTQIRNLKKDISTLNNLIYKKNEEKENLIKWILLQIRVKEKILKIPSTLEELVSVRSDSNPSTLEKSSFYGSRRNKIGSTPSLEASRDKNFSNSNLTNNLSNNNSKMSFKKPKDKMLRKNLSDLSVMNSYKNSKSFSNINATTIEQEMIKSYKGNKIFESLDEFENELEKIRSNSITLMDEYTTVFNDIVTLNKAKKEEEKKLKVVVKDSHEKEGGLLQILCEVKRRHNDLIRDKSNLYSLSGRTDLPKIANMSTPNISSLAYTKNNTKFNTPSMSVGKGISAEEVNTNSNMNPSSVVNQSNIGTGGNLETVRSKKKSVIRFDIYKSTEILYETMNKYKQNPDDQEIKKPKTKITKEMKILSMLEYVELAFNEMVKQKEEFIKNPKNRALYKQTKDAIVRANKRDKVLKQLKQMKIDEDEKFKNLDIKFNKVIVKPYKKVQDSFDPRIFKKKKVEESAKVVNTEEVSLEDYLYDVILEDDN